MQLQHLLSYVRRAVQDYNMIAEGDRIAIGISGGKDSLILALALSHLKRFYPKSFEIMGITVSLGFDNFDLSEVGSFFDTLQVPFYVCNTQIAQIIFEERKESNPCSLCSKMRKGALYEEAKEMGCTKIALGHNKDDINETLLMSLFYEGRIHTMAPVTYMDQVDLHIIRPLIYAPEKDIRGFVKKRDFQSLKVLVLLTVRLKEKQQKNLFQVCKEIFQGCQNICSALFKGALLKAGKLRRENKWLVIKNVVKNM